MRIKCGDQCARAGRLSFSSRQAVSDNGKSDDIGASQLIGGFAVR
jgi:hypothetical protein